MSASKLFFDRAVGIFSDSTFVPFQLLIDRFTFPFEQHLGEGCLGERPRTL